MKFKMQDYVRITSDYHYDRILRGEIGNIIDLPTREQAEEYLVRINWQRIFGMTMIRFERVMGAENEN